MSYAIVAHCNEVILLQMQQRMCIFPEIGVIMYCTPRYAMVIQCMKHVEHNLNQGIDLIGSRGGGLGVEGRVIMQVDYENVNYFV